MGDRDSLMIFAGTIISQQVRTGARRWGKGRWIGSPHYGRGRPSMLDTCSSNSGQQDHRR